MCCGSVYSSSCFAGRLLPLESNSPWQEPHQWKDISGEKVTWGGMCVMVWGVGGKVMGTEGDGRGEGVNSGGVS